MIKLAKGDAKKQPSFIYLPQRICGSFVGDRLIATSNYNHNVLIFLWRNAKAADVARRVQSILRRRLNQLNL